MRPVRSMFLAQKALCCGYAAAATAAVDAKETPARVRGARLLAALRARTAALASCGEQEDGRAWRQCKLIKTRVAFAKELTALQTRYETLVPPVSESYVDQAEALLLAAGGPHGGPRGWEEAAAGNSLQGGTLSEGEGRMRAEHAAARHSLLADAAQQEEGELDPDEVEDAAETQRLLDQLTDVVAQFKTSSAANLVQFKTSSAANLVQVLP
ncbi:hypothetical protein T484DRAFT_1832278 [Baffinella frigidus]|nr:hypothetical protein T484DRAFT_1832278 [Cryptophyta sp. CCMP2293]